MIAPSRSSATRQSCASTLSPYVLPSAKGETPIGVVKGDPLHSIFIPNIISPKEGVADTDVVSDCLPPGRSSRHQQPVEAQSQQRQRRPNRPLRSQANWLFCCRHFRDLAASEPVRHPECVRCNTHRGCGTSLPAR
jgi:hypothetical protein